MIVRTLLLPAKVGVGGTKLGLKAGYRTGRLLGYRRLLVFAAAWGSVSSSPRWRGGSCEPGCGPWPRSRGRAEPTWRRRSASSSRTRHAPGPAPARGRGDRGHGDPAGRGAPRGGSRRPRADRGGSGRGGRRRQPRRHLGNQRPSIARPTRQPTSKERVDGRRQRAGGGADPRAHGPRPSARRRALWGVLTAGAVVVGALVVTSGGEDATAPGLPVALGSSVADREASGAAADAMLAWVTYVPGDDLPALGGRASAYRLAANVTEDQVRALAGALELEGRSGPGRPELDRERRQRVPRRLRLGRRPVVVQLDCWRRRPLGGSSGSSGSSGSTGVDAVRRARRRRRHGVCRHSEDRRGVRRGGRSMHDPRM